MKSFLVIESSKHEYRQPNIYRLSIFEIINNIPQYITSTTYKPGLTRGIDSEAMNHLASTNHIDSHYTGYCHDYPQKDFIITTISRGFR